MISLRTVVMFFAMLAITAALTVSPFGEASAAPADSRILRTIDERDRVSLTGNTHPAAAARFDQGAVEPDRMMEGLRLVLRRSAQQEAALDALMAQQLDRRSANYHRWLTPAQFGALYGPSEADLTVLTDWLQGQGFAVEEVNSGRTFIRFSGSAARVAEAFQTEIHRFLVDGRTHVANSADPSIPAALAPVVIGIASLNDFVAKPLHHDLGAVRRDPATRRWTPTADQRQSGASFSPTGTSGYELMSPNDFAVIYNVLPLWNAGIDGSGQTIAIAGRSDIQLRDVKSFRAAFGLPANVPSIIVNGADPGVPDADEQMENTLDVEWSGAVARGAHIVFVTTASTYTDGAEASALYIVEKQIAPIISFSYGACERALGVAGNAAYNALWQQAAAEGISVFVAAGDNGAAACDFDGPPVYGAQHGLAVSGPASTPYDVAVGGTDLNWINNPSTSYWSGGAFAGVASALQYIPEVPWNSSCVSLAFEQWSGVIAEGFDPEQYCNQVIAQRTTTGPLSINGGGGGMSACVIPGPTGASSCAGGYRKPAWQSGIGVPPDGRRDVPDVALFAANGMLRTAYVICDSSSVPCNYGSASDALAQAVGGTSVASPAMAGIMALVNQKMGGQQGNANVGLYAMAARDNRATCNSVTVREGNPCNFYDITTDSNAVPCVAGSPNCVVLHGGDRIGTMGYRSTVGYDMATGLGTVNAANLVDHWHLGASSPSNVPVPNEVGATATAAGAALASAGLVTGTVTRKTNACAVAGTITGQSPVAGLLVASGSSVNLTVALAAPQVAVPNATGASPAFAATVLAQRGLTEGAVTQQSSTTSSAGTVVAQMPRAGTWAAACSSVQLIISSGPPLASARSGVK